MSNIIYNWNPFQTLIDNRILGEIIKPSDSANRVEFLVRRAPFFSHNFKLYRAGSATPLVLGTDYVFAHSFDSFISEYRKNAFGSVILLKPFAGDVLTADYDTIGSPFVLDEIAFVQLAANIIDNPRQARWEDLSDVPTEWPVDPHEHPVSQTYDYEEMMTALRSLILASTSANSISSNVEETLRLHLEAPLPMAHAATSADVGLSELPNLRAGTSQDLQGGSSNSIVTVALLKEALRGLRDGTLDIN